MQTCSCERHISQRSSLLFCWNGVGARLAATLRQHGVFPGDRIRVVRVAPFGGPILVEINQREVALGRRVAAKVIVEIEQRGIALIGQLDCVIVTWKL